MDLRDPREAHHLRVAILYAVVTIATWSAIVAAALGAHAG